MNSLPTFPAVRVPARRALSLALLFALVSVAPAGAKSISSPATQHGAPVSHGKKKAGTPAKSAPGEKAATSTAGGDLDGTERKIADAVDRGAPASFALLERVVNVNSGTLNFDGVRETARLLEPELTALGFTTKWVDGAAWGRAGHLLARREAGGEAVVEHARPGVRFASSRPAPKALPKVLLIGHLDTVFEKDSPFQKYQRLSDSTAMGPGICDMKGGDVVMLLALRALKEAGALDRIALSVYLGGDEEMPGEPVALARRDLQDAAAWADIAICLENGAGDPRVALIGRRGSSEWALTTTGKPHHSGQIFREDVGAGAIYEAARILDQFRTTLSSEKYLTFSPGTILGGTDVTWDSMATRGTAFGKNNVVAEHARVGGDLRALTPEQLAHAKQTMQGIVDAHLPQTGATITFRENYPPFAPTDGNRRLLSMYDRASRDLGLGGVDVSDPSRAGAGDIAFAASSVDMAIDGVGLMGSGGHTPDETADVRTLPTQAKRLAVTLKRIGEMKK